MINEYALEPALLSNWKDFRYFVDQFGISHGRLISRYPKRWKRMVYESLSDCGDRDKKRIEEALSRIDNKLLARVNEWDNQKTWLTNALSEHKRQPFHAVIAVENPESSSIVVKGDDLDETNTLWRASTEMIIPRNADAMARAAAPLLLMSRVLVFIDPHFGLENARYRNSIKAFLSCALSKDRHLPVEKIEIYTNANVDARFFSNECRTRLPDIVPEGINIRVVRLAERIHGEKLHNRFILTELGGISFRTGLDTGGPGETDEVGILSSDVYHTRFDQYLGTNPAFDLVDEITVTGKKK